MSTPILTTKREVLQQAFQVCRAQTLALLAAIDSQWWSCQLHPDFSPIGWHFGHIAFTEGHWLLEHCQGKPAPLAQYRDLFRADGLPKAERQRLPSPEVICDYLQQVRGQALDYLEQAPLESQARLWWWLIQHESQHTETIVFLRHLAQFSDLEPTSSTILDWPAPPQTPLVEIPAGSFEMGSNALIAQDNERPAHSVFLETYRLEQHPVTQGQYQQFIQAGGYQNPDYWSPEGWQWRQNQEITTPLYWRPQPATWHHPVYGVSYYEAQAYANFVGRRLPTEAEWEKAARWPNAFEISAKEQSSIPSSNLGNFNQWQRQTTPVGHFPQGRSLAGCDDLLGNVWEWTSSLFTPYPGFESYPYPGYSQAYFDQQHYVLRGGSWATRPWALRASFRNWYHPWVRQILAGFRCAV
jgi:ergothioneine biosynthesis protein EgtB